MKTYRVFGTITAGKYLGTVRANNEIEALEKAENDKDIENETYVSICHQCSNECDDPQITELSVQEIDEED